MENNEYELYRTVSIREKEELQRRLVKARCSYLEKWKKLSIFKRRDFGGAREVCVIYVNANQREQADAVLEEFLSQRQTRRRKRRRPGRDRDMDMEERVRQPKYREDTRKDTRQEPQTIAVEKVSPSSFDPYNVSGKPQEDEEYAEASRHPYDPDREGVYPVKEEPMDPGRYVLGDEYAELEYADEEEKPYSRSDAYADDSDFEDDYNEAMYEEEENFVDYDDDFDDDIYEEEPQYGSRGVKLINEDGDDGYFLDDGPRLRGSTKVRGGEGSDPYDEFVDDFNFD